jgi:hypothetical protein
VEILSYGWSGNRSRKVCDLCGQDLYIETSAERAGRCYTCTQAECQNARKAVEDAEWTIQRHSNSNTRRVSAKMRRTLAAAQARLDRANAVWQVMNRH